MTPIQQVPVREKGRKFSELTFDAMTHYLYRFASEGPLSIIIHIRPDGDCVGSAFAMKALLKLIGCETRVVCADKLPERLRFIAEGIQDEILYTTAEGPYAPDCGNRALCLDVASPSQLGCIDGSYNVLLVLDHHKSSIAVGDRYLDSTAAATGEIVWRIARNWLRAGIIKEIPEIVAQCVYAAVSSDTGCFRYSNVTAATHRIAAQLVAQIPDHSEIDRLLFEVKTQGRIEAEEAALKSLEIYEGGRISLCRMSREAFNALGVEYEELDALIDVARSVAGVEIAFSVREETDGRYRISARANVDVDVASLCAKFGGGGHIRAAGCTVNAPSMEDVVETVLTEARKILIPAEALSFHTN